MTHSFMTSAFKSAISQGNKSKKSLRSSNLNNSQPSLFDFVNVAPIDEEDEEMLYESISGLYQAVAVDYDGEEHVEYVEANSESEADKLASEIFFSRHISIYQMFLYQF